MKSKVLFMHISKCVTIINRGSYENKLSESIEIVDDEKTHIDSHLSSFKFDDGESIGIADWDLNPVQTTMGATLITTPKRNMANDKLVSFGFTPFGIESLGAMAKRLSPAELMNLKNKLQPLEISIT